MSPFEHGLELIATVVMSPKQINPGEIRSIEKFVPLFEEC